MSAEVGRFAERFRRRLRIALAVERNAEVVQDGSRIGLDLQGGAVACDRTGPVLLAQKDVPGVVVRLKTVRIQLGQSVVLQQRGFGVSGLHVGVPEVVQGLHVLGLRRGSGLEQRNGLGGLIRLQVGKAEPVLHFDRFRVFCVQSFECGDRLIGLARLEKSCRGDKLVLKDRRLRRDLGAVGLSRGDLSGGESGTKREGGR